MNHILYNISVKQKRSKQEQKEGKQMLIVNAMDQIWFSEEQLLAGYRLGCHVYAKEPLTVEIPN